MLELAGGCIATSSKIGGYTRLQEDGRSRWAAPLRPFWLSVGPTSSGVGPYAVLGVSQRTVTRMIDANLFVPTRVADPLLSVAEENIRLQVPGLPLFAGRLRTATWPFRRETCTRKRKRRAETLTRRPFDLLICPCRRRANGCRSNPRLPSPAGYASCGRATRACACARRPSTGGSIPANRFRNAGRGAFRAAAEGTASVAAGGRRACRYPAECPYPNGRSRPSTAVNSAIERPTA